MFLLSSTTFGAIRANELPSITHDDFYEGEKRVSEYLVYFNELIENDQRRVSGILYSTRR